MDSTVYFFQLIMCLMKCGLREYGLSQQYFSFLCLNSLVDCSHISRLCFLYKAMRYLPGCQVLEVANALTRVIDCLSQGNQCYPTIRNARYGTMLNRIMLILKNAMPA